MCASGGRVAGIGGTGIAVIAIGRCSADTNSSGTGVICGTGVAVVTGVGVVLMRTAGRGVAGIVSADISIIAIGRHSADTGSSRTGIIRGAGVAVVTGIRVVVMRTAGGRIAGIVGAGVAVIALKRGSGDALSVGRIAGFGTVAGVSIVAIFRRTTHADPGLALIYQRATVSIVARSSIEIDLADGITAVAVIRVAVIAFLISFHNAVSTGARAAADGSGATAILLTGLAYIADKVPADRLWAIIWTGNGVFRAVADRVTAITVRTAARIFVARFADKVPAKAAIKGAIIFIFAGRITYPISADLGGGLNGVTNGSQQET
jgi:hypothetical protein